MSSQDPLEARLGREAQFHDSKYGGGDLYPRHYRAVPTQYVYTQMRDAIGDLHGKRVLEYGCGEGWLTSDLARAGGTVCAFDISPQAEWDDEESYLLKDITLIDFGGAYGSLLGRMAKK